MKDFSLILNELNKENKKVNDYEEMIECCRAVKEKGKGELKLSCEDKGYYFWLNGDILNEVLEVLEDHYEKERSKHNENLKCLLAELKAIE